MGRLLRRVGHRRAPGDAAAARRVLAFFAPSRELVDTFWRTGVDAGYRDDGAPGPRPQYSPDYYGGFLLDPDGNSAEAVHNGSERAIGAIDHLWIRVADVDAAKRFYEHVALHAGFTVSPSSPEQVHVPGDDGSFSLVSGTSTEHVHLAFPAASDAASMRFTKTSSARATGTTVAPASGRSTTRGTTAHSSSIPMATTSSW